MRHRSLRAVHRPPPESAARRDALSRALHEADGRFRAGFCHAAIATALVARNGMLLQVNAALKLLLARRDFDAVRALDFVHADDRGVVRRGLRDLVRGRRHAFSVPVRCVDAAARTLWVQLVCSGVRDERGRAACFVVQAEDIGEHKRAESERERAHAELAQMLAVQRRVHALDQTLAAAASRDDAYRALDAACREIFPDHRVFLAVREPDAARFRRVTGDAGSYAAMLDASDCEAVRREQPHVVDAGSCALCRACRRSDSRGGHICVALTIGGRAAGVLHLDDVGDGDRVRELFGTLQMIADTAKGALSNIDARDRLREESMRDVLTGLHNRRYLLEAMPVEIERACRLHIPLVLAMVDIDHFKCLNDAYGHDAGDAVLRHVADVLQAGLRRVDVVCRYGGEEFVVVLPATHAEPARQRFNQLRMRLRGMTVAHRGRLIAVPTVSVGLAEFGPRSADAGGLLHAADEALYRAKASGRDRVELACADGYCGIWANGWCDNDDY